MLVITGVIFLMTALVVVGGISLRAKEKSYLAQETELKKQIDEEKARSQEIDDMEHTLELTSRWKRLRRKSLVCE